MLFCDRETEEKGERVKGKGEREEFIAFALSMD
jgi:hypothetical protein